MRGRLVPCDNDMGVKRVLVKGVGRHIVAELCIYRCN